MAVCFTLELESEGEPSVRRGINTPDPVTPVDCDATEPESDADQPKLRRQSHSTNFAASSRRTLSPATEISETEPEADDIHPSPADENRETAHVAGDDDDGGEGNELDGEIEYCPVRICISRVSLAPSQLLPSTTIRNHLFQLLQPRHFAALWSLTLPKGFRSPALLIATCASINGRGSVSFGIATRKVGVVSWEMTWVLVCSYPCLDSRFTVSWSSQGKRFK